MKVLVACEYSGVVRAAFHRRGHYAVSCDILPSEEPWYGFNPWHYKGDIREILERRVRPFYAPLNDVQWDLLIAHPPCTRLANSGVRWLSKAPEGKSLSEMWAEFHAAVVFYKLFRNTDIPRVAIENPIMHEHARVALNMCHYRRHVVQPWWFGEPAFKATGFELHNLPALVATNKLTPPKVGTEAHKAWSWVHRASPGPDRWKIRSRTFQGIADAMAEQWGKLI